MKSNNSPSTEQTMRATRAWPVVIFGLRYGFLVAVCGFAPSVNAVVTLRLLKHMAVLSNRATVEDSECFISQCSASQLIVLAGFATAFEYAADLDAFSWRTIFLDWIFATIAAAYVNASVFMLDAAGRALGERNFIMGNKIFMQACQSSGAMLPNTKPAPVGSSICGVCLFLLLFIAAS